MTDPRIEAATRAVVAAEQAMHTNESLGRQRNVARFVLAAIDKAATIDPRVESFINARPEYIEALKNTRGSDDQSDYWRWQGHAESRRQLAQSLGCTVPHEVGDKTERAAE